MPSPFTQKVKTLIRQIPAGKVASYGLIAALAGNPRAARQVAWVLHSSSAADQLPWHRVVNRNGKISLKPFEGYEIQKHRLLLEGIVFNEQDTIDLERYLWSGK